MLGIAPTKLPTRENDLTRPCLGPNRSFRDLPAESATKNERHPRSTVDPRAKLCGSEANSFVSSMEHLRNPRTTCAGVPPAPVKGTPEFRPESVRGNSEVAGAALRAVRVPVRWRAVKLQRSSKRMEAHRGRDNRDNDPMDPHARHRPALEELIIISPYGSTYLPRR